MSFWKKTLLGSDKGSSKLSKSSTLLGDDAPSSPPEAKPPPGPPPTATAYTHSSSSTTKQSTPPKLRQEHPPPKFHIFQPQQKETPAPTEDDTQPASFDEAEQPESKEDESNEWEVDESEVTQQYHASYNGKEQELHDNDVQDEQSAQVPEQTTAAHDDDDLMDDTGDLLLDAMDTKLEAQMLEPTNFEETMTPNPTDATTLVLKQEEEGTPLSPKFDFLNESVPLQKLQDSTFKRRHVSLTRIHELDCKLASLQAKLAHETMDRGMALQMSTRLESVLTQPLEAAVERCGNQLLFSPDGPLHSRICNLEARRMRHLHVELPDAVTENLESPVDYVTQELQASLRLEMSKADKRIGTMVRRFDSIAGTVARRHQEEAASRRAALVQVQSLAQDAADMDERRALEFLQSLEKLRQYLQRERQERRARDKEVMELIVERTTQLKRALLEAAGTGG